MIVSYSYEAVGQRESQTLIRLNAILYTDAIVCRTVFCAVMHIDIRFLWRNINKLTGLFITMCTLGWTNEPYVLFCYVHSSWQQLWVTLKVTLTEPSLLLFKRKTVYFSKEDTFFVPLTRFSSIYCKSLYLYALFILKC